MQIQLTPKWPKPWLIGAIALATLLSGGILYYGLSQAGVITTAQQAPPAAAPPQPRQIASLGRLEPSGEILKIAAPLALDGDRLAALRVEEGDTVQAGQILGVLDSVDRLESELLEAEAQVNSAQAKLEQVLAGEKRGTIAAQQSEVSRIQSQLFGDEQAQRLRIATLQAEWETNKAAQLATIQRLEAELANAKAEFKRYQDLHKQGVVTTSLFDSKALIVDQLTQQINEAEARWDQFDRAGQMQLQEAEAILARIQTTGIDQTAAAAATLDQLEEVRPEEVAAAQAELNRAQAQLLRARTNLDKAYIRAPQRGQVIKIYTRPGTQFSDDGLLALGQTQQMMAIAEVYQSDIDQIKIGQKAFITGQGFEGKLEGKVVEIGRQVQQQNVFSNEPGENLDRRVIEVKIKLKSQDSRKVDGLTNLQVQTQIEV